MVARSRNGTTKAFPVVETIHKDNICHTTEAPAQVPADVAARAQQVAEQAVSCLEGNQHPATYEMCIVSCETAAWSTACQDSHRILTNDPCESQSDSFRSAIYRHLNCGHSNFEYIRYCCQRMLAVA